jgi:type I restriction enzyme S subunit
MKNAFVALPPLETQRRIARFLDEKTGRIDALIEKKRALMDRLAEKRQALITRAVTKGLNPAAPMKPSGIDWLGDVPAHWEVLPLKRRITKIEQGWSPSAEDRLAAIDEWGVLKSGCVNDGVFDESSHKALPEALDPRPEIEVKSGDILMCRASGSLRYIGSVALVPDVRPKLMFSDKTYRIHLKPNETDSCFFVYSMAAKHLREQIVLSVSGAEGLANNIAQSSVGRYQHCFPPVREQCQIAAYIGKKRDRLGRTGESIKSAISQLQEYRAALVTWAVTGQIERLQ